PPTVVAGGARAAAAAAAGGGDGLFVALLDNISLSQILPSQGTTQGGTAETQEQHAIGGGDAADCSGSGSRSSSSNRSENKPASPTGGGAGGTPTAEEEGVGARQRRTDSSAAASSRSGADASQEGGLWSRSRLGLLGSLALQDSEDDDLDLKLAAHDAASSRPPSASHHCSPDGESRDKRQEHHRQQSLTRQHPRLAEAETVVSSRVGPALPPVARADADASPVSPLLLLLPARPVATNPGPPASMAATSSADTAAKDTGDRVETVPPESHAAEALPTAAASPLLHGTSPAQQRRPDVGSSPTLSPLNAPNAAVAGAAGAAVADGGGAQPAEATAASAVADGEVSSGKGLAGGGVDASIGLESSGAVGVAAPRPEGTRDDAGGNGREDSPAVSTVSSFNLDLSLTPECRRLAAAGAAKPPPAQASVRDSTDSCLSSLCLDLPSSVPPSSSNRGSATNTMSPPSGGLTGQTTAAAHPRGDSGAQSRSGGTRGDSIGSCSSHGRNSVAESDSPWSLRALSSEEPSPVSPYQGRRCSPAAAAGVLPDPPSSSRDHDDAIEEEDVRARGGQEDTTAAGAAIPLADDDDRACGSTLGGDRAGDRHRAGRLCASSVSGEPPGGGCEEGVASCPRPREGGFLCTAGGSAPALAAQGAGGGEGKLPEPRADEEDEEETEDVSPNITAAAAAAATAVVGTPRADCFPAGTGAVKACRVAGDLEGLDAREANDRRRDGLASSGAAGTGHAEGAIVLSGSGSTGSGSGGGGGGARVDSRSGEVAAIPTGPGVRSEEAVTATPRPVARSVGAELKTGAAAAGETPNQNRGVSRSRSGSIEKVYFTDGAAAKKRTNWAAGVCGRGELLSYTGEGGEASKKAAGSEGGVGDATTRGKEEVSTATGVGEGDPAADPAGRESEGLAGEGVLGEAAAAAEGESGPPPRRSPHPAAQGPRRVTSSTSAQQLVFTSEEESCGSLPAGSNASDSSLATDPSPVKFLATPPPPASVAVDRYGEGSALVQSKEAGPDARLRESPPCEPRAGDGAGEASKDKAGRGGGGKTAPDGRQRDGSEVTAVGSLPPRLPAEAAADKVVGLPGHGRSRLGLSTDAPHTFGADVAGAVVSATAGVAKPASGDGAPPPRSATWAGKRKAQLPPKKAGPASAATSAATAAAAAAAPVPARPSAGGWFSSRRTGAGPGDDDDDSPPTPSSSGVGAGGTATESPDLLLLAACRSAGSGRGPANKNGGVDPLVGPRSLGAGGRRASCGGGTRRGGGEGGGAAVGGTTQAAMSRSTSAPSRCGGGVSTAVGGTGVDSGGGRSSRGPWEVANSSGRRDAARGGKRSAGVVGDTLRQGPRRLGRHDLPVEDPAGTFPVPALEVISPDEIETTPPVAAPKKRLKARKLAAAAAAATTAVEGKPAA
ncbi:unnamed protein product, partial [Ectocarpus fasciculatus]